MSDPTPTPLTDAADLLSPSECEAVCICHFPVGQHRTDCLDLAARVTQIKARARAAARADERERCVAALIDAAPSIGFGMNHDGHEDPQASAYVEGWHDAWAALVQPPGPRNTPVSPAQPDDTEAGR